MMKNTVLYLFLSILFLVTACNEGPKNPISELIGPTEFKEKMETLPNAYVLDVRTIKEFEAGAISNAHNIDFYKSDFFSKIDKLDKKRPLLMYCRSGNRSGKAAIKFKEMGFYEVYDLKGGISAWSKKY